MNTEIESLISAFSHEKQRPREKDALHTLKKVASLVKPIMRARNWRVGTLCEFYPDQHNLLGLNVNRGQKICLRLRYAGDANQFLPMEDVVDTMLHELSHNVFGPHDAKFHALWDQLREEYEGLLRKGYTGEGFLSEGRRLGGRSVPMEEARRIARAAAERRRTLTAGSGQRLGGAAPRPGQDIRRVITDAIERRNRITKGCGATQHNEDEIIELGNRATANGFRTKAEEDKANDEAIAQALWEMVQEDEKAKYGHDYIQPSQYNPAGNISGGSTPATKPRPTTNKVANPRDTSQHDIQEAPMIPLASKPTTLMSNNPFKKQKLTPTPITQAQPDNTKARSEAQVMTSSTAGSKSSKPSAHTKWVCPMCTCHNPESFLCCDACATQRPPAEKRQYADENGELVVAESRKVVPKMWDCHMCGTHMEEQWWTCSTCGSVKLKS